MSEGFNECIVERKTSGFLSFIKVLLWILCGLCVVVAFMGITILVIVGMVFGVAAYFINRYIHVEYEYSYFDKELSVDKIYNREKRKHFNTYALEKIEICAPLKSYRLDSYRNRTFKEVDISSGIAGLPEVRYVFYYDGKEKITFEPNSEIVKALRNDAPRKVYTD